VDYFAEEIRDFVARVEAGEPPAVTVEDGYRVDRVIDALYRSGERCGRLRLDGDV
jgi:predicted dehydrogenase